MAAFAARTFDELSACNLAVSSTWLESNAPFEELSADEWAPVVASDLTVPYLFIEAFSKPMGAAGLGTIVVVAPARDNADAAERAARAGLHSLVDDAKAALEAEGVRVVILPGEPEQAMALFS
jgi:NAD(P)-dependent dehydrogenase (short-subunit alcohol dehydrogenase family)